jgi:hydantoinase/carbamoylase family amidase
MAEHGAEGLAVDPKRISARLAAFARIGYSSDGGMQRLAFSRKDLQARELLIHMLTTLGLVVQVDGIGNVFGRLAGTHPDLPSLLIGSHLDTVPGGGRFDGSLGVVAGLELMSILRAAALQPRHPIELVSFSCEESSRFGRGTLGSGIVAGVWEADELLTLRDRQGATLRNVLQRHGLAPDAVHTARRAAGDFLTFLELHIEQGRVLEEAELQLGVVTAIAAPTRFRLTLTGRADHSGATPMHLRQDALAGAAEVVLAVERAASGVGETVATVGALRVTPGVMNVVPGVVELDIDIRGVDLGHRQQVTQRIRDEITEISTRRRLRAELQLLNQQEPVALDPRIMTALEQACKRRGIRSRRMPSGAGHDAMQMARICPAGMLLAPSRAGISHNRAEWTDLDDIVAGVQIMVDVAIELAQLGVNAPLSAGSEDSRSAS